MSYPEQTLVKPSAERMARFSAVWTSALSHTSIVGIMEGKESTATSFVGNVARYYGRGHVCTVGSSEPVNAYGKGQIKLTINGKRDFALRASRTSSLRQRQRCQSLGDADSGYWHGGRA